MESEKPPKYLYKYKIWDNFGYTKTIIGRARLWFHSHDEFNDPFEIRGVQVVPTGDSDRAELAEALVDDRRPSLTKEGALLLKREVYNSMPVKEGAFYPSKGIGVFCLSEDPSNILMWSFYACDHSGVCIQFDTEKWLGNSLKKVRYSSSMYRHKWKTPINKEEVRAIAKLMTLRKSEDWKHEKEWRSLRDISDRPSKSKGKLFHGYSISLISAVIIGVNCSDDHRKEIKEVCDSRGIKVYEAKLSETKYAIEIPGLEE